VNRVEFLDELARRVSSQWRAVGLGFTEIRLHHYVVRQSFFRYVKRKPGGEWESHIFGRLRVTDENFYVAVLKDLTFLSPEPANIRSVVRFCVEQIQDPEAEKRAIILTL
jgi:hypothetical protein